MSEFELTEVGNLIRQIKEGKEELFRLIDPQIRKIVDVTCRELKISDHYEEVLVAVYERAIKGFDGFQGRSANELKGWLRKISENAARDFVSRTLRRMLPTVALANHGSYAEAAQPSDQEKAHGHLNLIRILKSLDPVEGYVLVLYSLLGYTFDEIAQVLKLPTYTARRRYIDIIKRIRKLEEKK